MRAVIGDGERLPAPLDLAAIAGRNRPRLLSHDGYMRFLCVSLAGYAIAGKGFALLGIPPLFIGEILLILGVVVLVRARCWVALGGVLPAVLLSALIAWGLCRTVGFLPTYGIDAVRDAITLVYGLFALVVASLLIEKPARLDGIVGAYAGLAWFYAIAAPVLLNIKTLFPDLPSWPGTDQPIAFIRLGEGAIHVAGTAVFVILGLRRVTPLWCCFLLVSLLFVTPSRGAMLSCLVPITIAIAFSGRIRQIGLPLLAGVVLLLGAYAAGLEITFADGRSVGPQQLASNFESLLGRSNAANLDGTKQWRLNWWHTIETYTWRGPYFWTGKGFGVNLAIDDGVISESAMTGPPLRSPHNVHYTMLARAGVPGFLLWLATEAAWFWMLARTALLARARGDTRWAKLLLWIICYGLAIVIDASFDVAIEGPMVGIWHWCIFGLGIGASMIYRAQPYPAGP